MPKVFPRDMQNMIKQRTDVKRYWVSENTSPRTSDCENCGGAGYLYVFAATNGPFNSPGSGHGVISKAYDGKWWIGGTYAFQCPVCVGSQAPKGLL